jgi:hypothetical protein
MSFEVSRLRTADRIVAVGAIGLFVFMFFFSWLGASVSGGGIALPGASLRFNSSFTGWEAFTVSRWVWLATILVALGMVALIATQREVNSPVSPSAAVAGLGGLSTLLILYRIVHHPHGGVSNGFVHVSWGIEIGIWLGLVAALAIAYGGYRAMQREGVAPTSDAPVST